MNSIVDIAGIKIKIDTNNKIGSLIAKDLEAISNIVDTKSFDIEIKFKNKIDLKSYNVHSGNNFRFNKNSYFYKYSSSLHYSIENLFNKKTIILNLQFNKKSKKDILRELLYGKNLSVNGILSYSLFWYIFQFKHVKFDWD